MELLIFAGVTSILSFCIITFLHQGGERECLRQRVAGSIQGYGYSGFWRYPTNAAQCPGAKHTAQT